ncbi:uncharacterized protein MONOS_15112 [Monocercomonoides exilis]|uniref:uncharacterized protein n=1 Tax=Monocercomonoides exilis TaxID=2049356 RepID=UPI0035597427|nr:hypothetical protein MONOS_15112 [Monocercomonoides exilis]|eukprot:MONOS_15112.1-p1 / transcript=MONOS_15112.1 / gene=MONOS_15112 / organism=Monocercomonoides_exilis_PA203 / gene_product=unspecified product / transcript_product=unspecified product / location=Mono_scaffold01147:9965-13322(-) / protein_length=1092 / sequence_SO=supercontig / SO=protein_coding / is_pseudo=false
MELSKAIKDKVGISFVKESIDSSKTDISSKDASQKSCTFSNSFWIDLNSHVTGSSSPFEFNKSALFKHPSTKYFEYSFERNINRATNCCPVEMCASVSTDPFSDAESFSLHESNSQDKKKNKKGKHLKGKIADDIARGNENLYDPYFLTLSNCSPLNSEKKDQASIKKIQSLTENPLMLTKEDLNEIILKQNTSQILKESSCLEDLSDQKLIIEERAAAKKESTCSSCLLPAVLAPSENTNIPPSPPLSPSAQSFNSSFSTSSLSRSSSSSISSPSSSSSSPSSPSSPSAMPMSHLLTQDISQQPMTRRNFGSFVATDRFEYNAKQESTALGAEKKKMTEKWRKESEVLEKCRQKMNKKGEVCRKVRRGRGRRQEGKKRERKEREKEEENKNKGKGKGKEEEGDDDDEEEEEGEGEDDENDSEQRSDKEVQKTFKLSFKTIQRKCVKQQIAEAKKFLKRFGIWVRKEGIKDEEEAKLWEEAEDKMARKTVESKGKGRKATLEELEDKLKQAELQMQTRGGWREGEGGEGGRGEGEGEGERREGEREGGAEERIEMLKEKIERKRSKMEERERMKKMRQKQQVVWLKEKEAQKEQQKSVSEGNGKFNEVDKEKDGGEEGEGEGRRRRRRERGEENVLDELKSLDEEKIGHLRTSGKGLLNEKQQKMIDESVMIAAATAALSTSSSSSSSPFSSSSLFPLSSSLFSTISSSSPSSSSSFSSSSSSSSSSSLFCPQQPNQIQIQNQPLQMKASDLLFSIQEKKTTQNTFHSFPKQSIKKGGEDAISTNSLITVSRSSFTRHFDGEKANYKFQFHNNDVDLDSDSNCVCVLSSKNDRNLQGNTQFQQDFTQKQPISMGTQGKFVSLSQTMQKIPQISQMSQLSQIKPFNSTQTNFSVIIDKEELPSVPFFYCNEQSDEKAFRRGKTSIMNVNVSLSANSNGLLDNDLSQNSLSSSSLSSSLSSSSTDSNSLSTLQLQSNALLSPFEVPFSIQIKRRYKFLPMIVPLCFYFYQNPKFLRFSHKNAKNECFYLFSSHSVYSIRSSVKPARSLKTHRKKYIEYMWPYHRYGRYIWNECQFTLILPSRPYPWVFDRYEC